MQGHFHTVGICLNQTRGVRFQFSVFFLFGVCLLSRFCIYFCRVASPPRQWRSCLFCSRISRTSRYREGLMCFKRSVTSLCTVDLLMPNFAAVCLTVFLLSAIYSPSLTARSHALPFKKDSSFSLDVVLCIWRKDKFILSIDRKGNFV